MFKLQRSINLLLRTIMNTKTNLLVSKAKRLAAPAGAVATVLLSITYLFGHNGLRASAMEGGAAMNESSVSSLVALDSAVEAVAARVSPAVVNVAVTSRGSEEERASMQEQQGQGEEQELPPGLRQFFGPGGPFGGGGQQGGGQGRRGGEGQQLEHGIGSGVIISQDGYIVTNNHVVDGAVEMKVTLNDRRVLKAKLVGVDKLTDLAVIKVDAKDLPAIAWGDSTALRPGQTVLAFGSPFGYFQDSVTRGIVSAVNRDNPYKDDARKPGGYIQTDAAINPGNSGGALVNAHGELVGINTFIISNSGSFAGAGFAIPSQIVRSTAEQLIKTGAVHHGYLGISMNDVTPENASFFNLKTATGAIVAQVSPDSPAAKAGLKSGDVIDELNGHKITNGSALQVAVSENQPGDKIALGVLRNGSPMTIDVTVGEFHNPKEIASNDGQAAPQGGKLGLAVDDLTADVRQQLRLPEDVRGVAIEQVRPGSAADDAGLAPGDVILEVNRKPATSAQDFVSAVHAIPEGKDILLLVWSKGGSSFRVVHPDSGNQSGM
jgi:serine protease Do